MIDKQVIYFFIYCFVGWICEVVYCSIPQKRFINRGFLHGPYLPIYGSGALAVLYLVKPFVNNFILLFLFGALVCSAIEYFASWMLEKAFHIKLWDYKEHFGNINGRVCLLNSTLFGILCLVVIYTLHPLVIKLVDFMPESADYYMASLIEILITFDFAISVIRMRAFATAMEDIRLLGEELTLRVNTIQAHGNQSRLQAKEKLQKELNLRKAKIAATSLRIFKAYPSMTYRDSSAKLRLDLFKMEMKSFLEKGREEQRKRKQQLNLMYENKKAQLKKAKIKNSK